MLKHRRLVHIKHDRRLTMLVALQVGRQRFQDLVKVCMRDYIADSGATDPIEAMVDMEHIPWSLLHYYDIPDGPARITEEEKRAIEYALTIIG